MRQIKNINRRTALKTIGAIGASGTLLGSPLTGSALGYDSALESFYELDDTSASDSSGNGNDGTVNGASSGATGISNHCFSFDGTEDSIDVPHVLSGLSQGSYSVWVNANSFGEEKAILGDWDGGSIVLYYNDSNNVWSFAARFGGTIQKVTGGVPTTGSWVHLVVTYDGSILKLYVDDTEVDSTSASGSLDSESDIQLGTDEGNSNSNHNYWDGRIDEVRTYSRGLSSTEVSELYNNPGSADLGSGSGEDTDSASDDEGANDSVTDIQYDYRGLAFEPSNIDYNPSDEWIFPSIIETSNIRDSLGKYYMYCSPHGTGSTKDGQSIGIALFYSDTLDNNSWTEHPDNPIIAPDWSPHYQVSHIASPHAIWLDEYDKLFLYFHGENDETRWATSKDGVNFDYGGIAITARNMPESSESSYARVYDYSIPNRSNEYTMFFMDNQSGTRHIRMATSTDAKDWTIDPDNIISPASDMEGNVSNPFFFKYRGSHYLTYHGSSDKMYVTEVGRNIHKEDHKGVFASPSSGEGRTAGPFLIKDEQDIPWMYYSSGAARLNTAIGFRKLTDAMDAKHLNLFDPSK